MISTGDSAFVIKGSKWNIFFGVMASLVSLVELFELCFLIVAQIREKTFNIMPIGFSLLYFAVASAMSVYGFFLYSKEFIIDTDGIKYRNRRKNLSLSWGDIKDYGISFSGISRYDGNAYYLYFAPYELETLSIYRKNVTADILRIRVSGDDYYTVLREILPFCQRYTSIGPFISEK